MCPHGYLSGVGCRCFTYGSTETMTTPSSFASSKCNMGHHYGTHVLSCKIFGRPVTCVTSLPVSKNLTRVHALCAHQVMMVICTCVTSSPVLRVHALCVHQVMMVICTCATSLPVSRVHALCVHQLWRQMYDSSNSLSTTCFYCATLG